MEINITLFIQGINFYIAYILFKVMLFKPALAVLDDQQANKQSLLAEIESRKETYALAHDAKDQQWHECQNYFAHHRPVIKLQKKHARLDDAPLNTEKFLDAQEQKKIEHEVKQSLVQKVGHVHW